jgi:hypothetical protein
MDLQELKSIFVFSTVRRFYSFLFSKMINIFFSLISFLSLALFSSEVWSIDIQNQKKLPACRKIFDNCWGEEKTTNGKYIGEFKNGSRSGLGNYYFGNGDTYSGEFANGQPNGVGTYLYTDGKIVKGRFRDNVFVGEIKTTQQPDSSKSTDIDKPSSPAQCPGIDTSKQTFTDQVRSWNNCVGEYDFGSNILRGFFKNGLPDGRVNLRDKNGWSLTATWEKGVMLLRNVEILYKSGDKYSGDINSDLAPHGTGTFVFRDGTRYVGQVANGEAHGIGRRTGPNGQTEFEGKFAKGYPEKNNSSANNKSMDMFMDQMINGGDLYCSQKRDECKRSNNYHECMYYFNKSQPTQGINDNPRCIP